MADADIFWKNIKTLYVYKQPNSEYGYELRIGRWAINGQDRDIILAKQEFKETVSGMIVWGKIKGLGANDMYRIFGMAAEISELMKFPLHKELSKQKELALEEKV